MPREDVNVTRSEFDSLREFSSETAANVNQLLSITRSQSDQINDLSSDVKQLIGAHAEMTGRYNTPQGINTNSLLTFLGVLASFAVIAGMLVVQYVEGKTLPGREGLVDLREDFKVHVERDGHPGMEAQMASIRSQLHALQAENETQHRWISDIINLQSDWIRRTDEESTLGPPAYTPMRGIGSSTPVKNGHRK